MPLHDTTWLLSKWFNWIVCCLSQGNIALVKNLTLHGVYWGSYAIHSPRILRRSLEDSVKWYGEGKVRTHKCIFFIVKVPGVQIQAFSSLIGDWRVVFLLLKVRSIKIGISSCALAALIGCCDTSIILTLYYRTFWWVRVPVSWSVWTC